MTKPTTQTTTEQKINQIVSGQLKSAMKAHPDQIKFTGSGIGSASKRITNAIISQLEGILNER